MHKTKIITTLGPATDSLEQIDLLHSAGAHIARLNFSHGEDSWFTETIARVQAVNNKHSRKLAILVDTKGPEIRTQTVDTPARVEENGIYRIGSSKDEKADIYVDYPYLTRDIGVGQLLLIDGGTITMRVTGHEGSLLLACAEQSGVITSKRHVNVPGVELDLPVLDAADERRLKICLDAGADMIALSFINQAKDLDTVRAFVAGITDRQIPLISKIETQTALDNIESIVEASDGIMVARGDLAMEIPMELLPTAQKHILAVCHRLGKPCIIATHMMKSMTDFPTPTRAEILDVGHAVYDGADSVMLSEETSVGKFPIDTVRLMARIAAATEKSLGERPVWTSPTLRPHEDPILQAAVAKLHDEQGSLFVYHAKTIQDVQHVASMRLAVSCIAVSTDESVSDYAALAYGQHGCTVSDTTDLQHSAAVSEMIQEIEKKGAGSKPVYA